MMSRYHLLFAGCLLGAAVGVASPASAASTINVTYTGTVYDSYNETGEFGMTGLSSLDGLAYTLAFTFDLSAAPPAIFDDGGYYEDLRGGSVYGVPSVGSAALTINGETKTIDGSYNSRDLAENQTSVSGTYTLTYQYAADITNTADTYSDHNASNNIYNYLGASSDLPDSITTPVMHAVTSDDTWYGYFGFLDSDDGLSTYTQNVYGGLRPEYVTISIGEPVSTVPLPAALPLFVSALGGLGVLGWRRRRVRPV